MATEIEIDTPVLRCQSEEDVFFQRLAEIAGVQKVVAKSAKIYLTVDSQLELRALAQLREIADMWNVGYQVVR